MHTFLQSGQTRPVRAFLAPEQGPQRAYSVKFRLAVRIIAGTDDKSPRRYLSAKGVLPGILPDMKAARYLEHGAVTLGLFPDMKMWSVYCHCPARGVI